MYAPNEMLRGARYAADGRSLCMLREYSHWKRCRRALFSDKCGASRQPLPTAMADTTWCLEEEEEEEEEEN